ncbi:Neurogenic differentiation factor 6-A [Schistosoma japonicum]|uniref:Neurogenic differentiation factor 6-A n=1 Tax=Schistosoma japonicum TaxID=6182 RepID=A0A4Z2CU76_SCHJA|nr:Neurogenic differentiation factor 6-A [Schistosoma japonicum]
MSAVNWSNFDQPVVFTEKSKNSFFTDINDTLKSIPIYQHNQEMYTDSFHLNSVNFIQEQLKHQENSTISAKNVQRTYATKRHQKCTTSDSINSQCFVEPASVTPNGTRRRGPKKKPDSQERVVRMKMRRARANARERSRMHGLNSALDALRQHIPSALVACNYIGLLASILNDIHFESITDIIKYLCHGLSQITTNQIAAALQSDPSRLMKHQVPTNQSTSLTNFNHSIENYSLNCKELLKTENYLSNNKLYECSNLYECSQYDMNECNLTFPYFPTNYNVNSSNTQLSEPNKLKNWINETKLPILDNEQINLTSQDTMNTINASIDSDQLNLNTTSDLKCYSYYYTDDLYYDAYRMMNITTCHTTDNCESGYTITMSNSDVSDD